MRCTDHALRDNIVFLLAGRIIGFESFYFQNGGTVASRFAFRVAANLRGKGYGRYVEKRIM